MTEPDLEPSCYYILKMSTIVQSTCKSQVVACLREVDATKITKEQFVIDDHVQFGPIVDGRWIRDDPKQMLEKERFKKCPIMAGVNTNEASYFMLYEMSDLMDLDGYKMNQDQLKSPVRKLFATNYDYPNITVKYIVFHFVFVDDKQ